GQQPQADRQQDSSTASDVTSSVATSDVAPPVIKVAPSQGLIAIDGATQIGYVPVYAQNSSGDALVAVVDLDPNSPVANNPVIATIALTGSVQPTASS